MSALDEIREQVEDSRYSDEFVGIVVRAKWAALLADIEALVAVAEAAQALRRNQGLREPHARLWDALDRLHATQPAETQ